MRVFNCLSGGILCGLTLLLIFLPCFTPEWAGNLIFISLSAIPICIADGIIFAILLWKHNRWWMLYLLLLLGSSPILSGYFPLHFLHREEVPDSNQLKLVCWNAEGFRLNKDTLAKAIHSIRILQPGIVCLQERPHTNLLAWDTIRAAFPDYPYCIVNSREDEILNLAVFSRWPVGNVQEYYFPDSYNKMLQADIRMIGQTFRLFNVHLQTTGMNESSSMKDRLQTMRHHAIRRNRQADLLANAIAESPYPVIVCGGFVCLPENQPVTAGLLPPGRPDMERQLPTLGRFFTNRLYALFTCIPSELLPTGFQSLERPQTAALCALSGQTLLKNKISKND